MFFAEPHKSGDEFNSPVLGVGVFRGWVTFSSLLSVVEVEVEDKVEASYGFVVGVDVNLVTVDLMLVV